ncbi:sporulation YhaL family protein [Bacillus kexueae]|uniref:sporulation YhaL family protein n=1 Tax=Aeribacillus kexueae TaxID=2078952 RepID=UPI001FAF532C|nr:sporulation YhaL family protein [Bacillus kexueae]
MILLPWWVYLCIIGILYSGYMAFTTTKKEKEVEQIFIEREGNIYLERMKKEKEKRQKEKQAQGEKAKLPSVQ